jgi:hypothetical protein
LIKAFADFLEKVSPNPTSHKKVSPKIESLAMCMQVPSSLSITALAIETATEQMDTIAFPSTSATSDIVYETPNTKKLLLKLKMMMVTKILSSMK